MPNLSSRIENRKRIPQFSITLLYDKVISINQTHDNMTIIKNYNRTLATKANALEMLYNNDFLRGRR